MAGEVSVTSCVSLLVNQQDLEDDDRFGWLADAIGGDTVSIQEAALRSGRNLTETLTAAQLLYDEGYLEVIPDEEDAVVQMRSALAQLEPDPVARTQAQQRVQQAMEGAKPPDYDEIVAKILCDRENGNHSDVGDVLGSLRPWQAAFVAMRVYSLLVSSNAEDARSWHAYLFRHRDD